MSSAGLFWLMATLPVFLGAASLARLYAGGATVAWMAGSLFLYGLGNVMMIRVMRESGLAMAISASSIAQLLLVNLVAFLAFGERLPPVQLLGMGLGTVGLVLMMWPQGMR